MTDLEECRLLAEKLLAKLPPGWGFLGFRPEDRWLDLRRPLLCDPEGREVRGSIGNYYGELPPLSVAMFHFGVSGSPLQILSQDYDDHGCLWSLCVRPRQALLDVSEPDMHSYQPEKE
jgi:hypothetical protein